MVRIRICILVRVLSGSSFIQRDPHFEDLPLIMRALIFFVVLLTSFKDGSNRARVVDALDFADPGDTDVSNVKTTTG